MGLFTNRSLTTSGRKTVPVWFMRQAGRYHSHYQNIKTRHTFMEMCKDPKLACEVTLGPIDDFKFDAAILFSDLLFPLEHLGLGLTYAPGPKLEIHVDSKEKIQKLKTVMSAKDFYDFQGQACKLLRTALPKNVDLLGFVGAPFTLYTYAVEGGHSGAMALSKKGLYDGSFELFMEKLLPSLLEEMKIQAAGGIQAMCLFDTAAGELSLTDYKRFAIPQIRWIAREFKKSYPEVKIIYYSKLTHLAYLQELECSDIDVLGVDWRHHLPTVFKALGKDYFIQGNFDPAWLHLPWEQLEKNLCSYWEEMVREDVNMSRWIMGLGHGVLIETPEINVRRAVDYIHTHFTY